MDRVLELASEIERLQACAACLTDHARGRGSGLGLAAVSSLARAHGGSIELDSAPGKGTRFTVLIPAAKT